MWQILSSDYDTQASFYGVKKACEPVHVQLDLSDYTVAVVNTTTAPNAGVTITANVYSLDNKPLLHHEERKDAAANAVTAGFKLDLAPLMVTDVVLVKLELRNASGQLLSDNLYWLGGTSAAYRQLTRLPAAHACGIGYLESKRRYESCPCPAPEHGDCCRSGEQTDAGECVRQIRAFFRRTTTTITFHCFREKAARWRSNTRHRRPRASLK